MERPHQFCLLLLLKTALCLCQNFNLFTDYELEGKFLTEERDDFESPCRCRELCYTDPECRAVAIPKTGEPPGEVTCAFLRGRDEVGPQDYLKAKAGARTYVKGASCYPPMQLVKEVGCLYVSTAAMSQTDAKTKGCSAPMKLYAPHSEEVFFKLAKFLKDGDYPGDYWVWLERLANNTWVWEDGKYAYGTSEYEKGVWASSNPSSDGCAKMRRSADFKLSDRACDEPYPFICTMA